MTSQSTDGNTRRRTDNNLADIYTVGAQRSRSRRASLNNQQTVTLMKSTRAPVEPET